MKRYDSYKDSGVQWIGEIPSHWQILKFRRTLQIVRGGSPRPIEKFLSEEGLNWIKIGDTIKGNKYIQSTAQKIKAEGLSATRLVKPGDLILSNSMSFGQPYILAIEGCIHDGWLSLSPSKELDKEFLYYMLLSDVCKNQFASQVDGGVVQNLNIDKVKDSLLFLPRLEEQTAIANYLDNKCSKIDKVIAAQEKRVELLRELKQSIITRAVTRGINPDAKMKDSGVEWIGEIPEHWEVMPIKRLSHIQTGTTPSTKVPEYFEPEEIKWFTPSDVTDDLVMTSASRFVSNKAKDDGACRMFPPKSIYFVGIGATIGKVGVCDEEASSNQQINALMVNKKANYKYLAYILRCQKDEIYLSANVVTLPIINQEKTGELLSPVPPIEEQELIVTYIEQQTTKLDSFITKALRQIELLKEYKQSLITEVVTGKRKVIYN